MSRVAVALLLFACRSTPPPVPVPDPQVLAGELAGVATGLERAVTAHACASQRGLVGGSVLTVIDYARPSTDERLWVLDIESRKLLFRELVAHGKGSGANLATSSSNTAASKTSSIGLFRTLEGKHGYSLKLRGLEPGINDNAEDRSIVIHGADYATAAFARKHGRLGRSWDARRSIRASPGTSSTPSRAAPRCSCTIQTRIGSRRRRCCAVSERR